MSTLPLERAISRMRIWQRCRITILLLLSAPAMAWNSAGHRLSAMIAWERLDETTRQAVTAILRQHPDYARWQAHANGADADITAFVEASTWPDDIRRDRRFYTAEVEEPTPTLAGFPDMERRLNWHYVDRPVAPMRGIAPSPGSLDQQLPALLRILGDRKARIGERAYALPWLLHLVADAHQPLHAASRYGPDGQSDQGGNRVMIENPQHSRRPSRSLHQYWDDLPGPPWLRGSHLELAASSLSRRYPPPASIGTPALWLEESWQIARAGAYPREDAAVVTITAEFHERSREVANRRLAEAGHRIAGILRQALRE